MIDILISALVGIIFTLIIEGLCARRYGYPILAVLTAKCKASNRFKFLAMNIWGNDDWYYDSILR